MIRLGLRLTLRGGTEAATRLVLTAVAVALGVGLLLVTLAGINALVKQNDRASWLNTGIGGPGQAGLPGHVGPPGRAVGHGQTGPPGTPLWWLLTADRYGSRIIDRVDVAATGPGAPAPPGLARLPGPGQFYVSPALAALLRTTPADQLGNRFQGRQAGIIGPAALPAPNSLIIIIGHAPGQLSRAPGAVQVTSFQTAPGGHAVVGYDASTVEFLLAVGALALMFPVLVFIGTATRLAAARREQRFAAIRLTGATPRQIAVIAAVEASLSAVAGVAAGFGLYLLLHPLLLAAPSFTGEPFAPGDLSLNLADVLTVAIGVPVAAAGAARVALRRVQISPLGVTRRVTPPAPRVYRLILLAAGLAELGYFVGVGHPKSSGDQVLAYTAGFGLTMAGVITAGPWLTMAGARLLARRTSRPAALIAGRRLADNPRAAFRSVGGLILALFVTSVSAGITTTIIADHAAPSDGVSASDTVADSFVVNETAAGKPVSAVAAVPRAALARLGSVPGVRGVTAIHVDPDAATSPDQDESGVPGLVSCAQLARTPALGHCPAGAAVATIALRLSPSKTSKPQASVTWPAAQVSAARLASLPVQTLAVGTSGSFAAVERVTTTLENAFPYLGPPTTLGAVPANDPYAELQRLTDMVIVVSLVIAGCGLAVSAAAGLTDRKRPFSLLRLAGAQLGVLRQVVALESAVPLVVIALLSAASGFGASDLFLRSELSETLRLPGPGYYVIMLAGLAVSLGIIACTFPLLDRMTGPEVARND